MLRKLKKVITKIRICSCRECVETVYAKVEISPKTVSTDQCAKTHKAVAQSYSGKPR